MIIKMLAKYDVEQKEYVISPRQLFFFFFCLTAILRNKAQHEQTVKNFASDDPTAKNVRCDIIYLAVALGFLVFLSITILIFAAQTSFVLRCVPSRCERCALPAGHSTRTLSLGQCFRR